VRAAGAGPARVADVSARLTALKAAFTVELNRLEAWAYTRHRGQGKSLVPPYICGSVSPSLSSICFSAQLDAVLSLKAPNIFHSKGFVEVEQEEWTRVRPWVQAVETRVVGAANAAAAAPSTAEAASKYAAAAAEMRDSVSTGATQAVQRRFQECRFKAGQCILTV